MSSYSDTSPSSTTAATPKLPKGKPTPLRRRFIEHLILQQKAPRTVEAYTSWIYDLAQFHHRSPNQLGHAELRAWLLHLITERKLAASTVNWPSTPCAPFTTDS